MISENQILSLSSRISEWGKNYKKGKEETYYFSEAHKFRSEVREALSYHAEFGVFPEKLINSAAPNEDKAEYEYRKKNYKQITKPYWDKAVSSTNRIYNKQNYSIEWGDEDIENYFTYTYPVHGDYEQWFIDVVHPMKFADPNAVLAIKPAYIPGELNDEGVFVVDQAVEVSPIAVLFEGCNVFEVRDDFCLLLSKEKSPVFSNGKTKNEGLVFEIYDDTNIYVLVQTGDKTDWKFLIDIYYQHNWEYVPAWCLKGTSKEIDGEVVYFSHMQCALPNLDQAAFLNSTSFGVINKVAYPTRIYYEDSCNNCNGEGWVENYETHLKGTCPDCRGTGKRFTFTWGKDYVIPIPENQVTGTDTTTLPSPPISFTDPPVESIKFLDEKVKYLLESAFQNMNIHITEQPTGVTATEVDDDKDEFISFLLKIAREEFYLLEESIHAQTFLKMGKEDIVKVNQPIEFRVRTTSDITEELKDARDAKLPPPYQYKLQKEALQQRFSSDAMLEEILKVVSLIDPMAGMDDSTIQQLSNTGVIEKWRVTLHYFIYNFIYNRIDQDDQFLTKDIDSIRAEVEAAAQSATPKEANKAADIFSSLKQ